MMRCGLVLSAAALCSGASDLCMAENGVSPKYMGDLIRVGATSGTKHVIATGLEDPVWVAVQDGFVYVGLFHPGQIVQVDLSKGTKSIVPGGQLSCPEGVGLDKGYLYVVENPVGNECQQPHRKPAAQLTRINITSGEQTKVAPLKMPHGMDVDGGYAYVCEYGAHQVTRVDLESGEKVRVAGLSSPSGCAVGGGYAYGIEQGNPGELVKISLSSGAKTTLINDLRGPHGVAVDVSAGFAYAGEGRRVRRVPIAGGASDVLIESLNSPVWGIAKCDVSKLDGLALDLDSVAV